MLPLSTFGSELRCIGYSETRQPFFGDLHIHTKYSLDASTQATRTTPDQVYSFAKGEKLGIQPWYDDKPQRFLQLSRPLDFAMVSDHAELLGETHLCSTQGVPQYEAWQCTMYRDWPRAAFYWFNYWSAQHGERVGFCDDGSCKQAALSPWQDIQNAAEKHYDRSEQCRFTTSSVTNGPVVGPGKRREILIEILYLEGRECQNYRTLSLMIPPLKVYTKA